MRGTGEPSAFQAGVLPPGHSPSPPKPPQANLRAQAKRKASPIPGSPAFISACQRSERRELAPPFLETRLPIRQREAAPKRKPSASLPTLARPRDEGHPRATGSPGERPRPPSERRREGERDTHTQASRRPVLSPEERRARRRRTDRGRPCKRTCAERRRSQRCYGYKQSARRLHGEPGASETSQLPSDVSATAACPNAGPCHVIATRSTTRRLAPGSVASARSMRKTLRARRDRTSQSRSLLVFVG